MAAKARRALVESAKGDLLATRESPRDDEIDFTAESFFEGLDAGDLFEEPLDISISPIHPDPAK